MPMITIIDEQRCALEQIRQLAHLGVADPARAQEALASVLFVIGRTTETIESALTAVSVPRNSSTPKEDR